MRRAGARAAVAVALAAVAITAVSAGAGSAAPASVVDRTYSCETTVTRGARTIEINASSALRKRGRLSSQGQIVVSSGNDPSVPASPPALAAVVAGYPPPRSFPPGALGIAARRLAASRHHTRPSSRRSATRRGRCSSAYAPTSRGPSR